MFGHYLEAVRSKAPLIHNITNYVTANDCANLLLACGASPIMADDPAEVAEVQSACAGLHLNLGTLHTGTVPALLAAGRTANTLGHPVVLDPVGVGVSALRGATARQLLTELHIAVIRGNLSEMKVLARGGGAAHGVDACDADAITEENLDALAAFVKDLARRTGAVIAVSGTIDLVADENTVYCIRNGCAMMRRVTGTGCQLSALTAAFAAASPDRPLEAAAAAVCAMGLCGEIAQSRLAPGEGNAALRGRIIDAMYNLTPRQLEEGALYETR